MTLTGQLQAAAAAGDVSRISVLLPKMQRQNNSLALGAKAAIDHHHPTALKVMLDAGIDERSVVTALAHAINAGQLWAVQAICTHPQHVHLARQADVLVPTAVRAGGWDIASFLLAQADLSDRAMAGVLSSMLLHSGPKVSSRNVVEMVCRHLPAGKTIRDLLEHPAPLASAASIGDLGLLAQWLPVADPSAINRAIDLTASCKSLAGLKMLAASSPSQNVDHVVSAMAQSNRLSHIRALAISGHQFSPTTGLIAAATAGDCKIMAFMWRRVATDRRPMAFSLALEKTVVAARPDAFDWLLRHTPKTPGDITAAMRAAIRTCRHEMLARLLPLRNSESAPLLLKDAAHHAQPGLACAVQVFEINDPSILSEQRNYLSSIAPADVSAELTACLDSIILRHLPASTKPPVTKGQIL